MALDSELKMLIEHIDGKIDTLAEGYAAHTEKLDTITKKLDAQSEKLDAQGGKNRQAHQPSRLTEREA